MTAQVRKITTRTYYTAEERREISVFFSQLIAGGVKEIRIAHEAGITEAALAAFLDGADDFASSVALDDLQRKILSEADSGGFVKMPSGKKIIDALESARSPRLGLKSDRATAQRGIALIFGAAGIGKTTTVEWYAKQQNRFQGIHKIPVLLIEVPGGWRSRKIMLEAIAAELQKKGYSLGWHDPESAIMDAIPYGGLIAFDQAHRLSTARLDELSYFTDKLSIAVALMGNLTGYAEFCRKKLDSITRSVNGRPVYLDLPTEEDIISVLNHARVAGHGIPDHAILLGMQPCGIDYLFKTIHAAKIIAAANGVPVDLEIFKLASVRVGAWGEQS